MWPDASDLPSAIFLLLKLEAKVNKDRRGRYNGIRKVIIATILTGTCALLISGLAFPHQQHFCTQKCTLGTNSQEESYLLTTWFVLAHQSAGTQLNSSAPAHVLLTPEESTGFAYIWPRRGAPLWKRWACFTMSHPFPQHHFKLLPTSFIPVSFLYSVKVLVSTSYLCITSTPQKNGYCRLYQLSVTRSIATTQRSASNLIIK